MERDRNHRGASWSLRKREKNRLRRILERSLTRAEECLDRGESEEAARVLSELPEGPFPETQLHVRAADAWSDLQDAVRAEAHYRAALELDPRSADALHGLGFIHAARGEHQRTIELWLQVRTLDLSEPPAPWALSVDDFTAIAEAALEDIPEAARPHLANLPILVTDVPSEALVRDGIDPRILGLITGPGHSNETGLDCVQLYQRNLERFASSAEELEEEIRVTVLHETAHYFGLDDEELEAMGLG